MEKFQEDVKKTISYTSVVKRTYRPFLTVLPECDLYW